MHSPEKSNEYQWLLLNYKPLQSGLKDGENMEVTNASNTATSDINLDHRTLDEYLEEAYNFDQNHLIKRWKYMRMILALGLCGVGDATEMLSIGYVLSDPTFQQQMMHNDMNKNGALVASSITAGMIVGALLVSFFLLSFLFFLITQDYFSLTQYFRNNSCFFHE
jgi:multisubunit Na+/H+ antiporter MnhC subunit